MVSTEGAVILGGGFAGLSCATALAEAGVPVTLLEKRPHLGGRAYSFKDPRTGRMVDNGQHLFMGCYRQTRAFLRRIGSEGLLRFAAGVRVDYADADGGRDCLRCPGVLPAPFHLAAGVARLKGLSWEEKCGLLRLARYFKPRLGGSLPPELDGATVRQWLDSLGQSRRIQERLFDPITIGALNEEPKTASALGFAQVLREMFFRDSESSRLGLATVALSELYTGQARRFIEARGGNVLLSQAAAAIEGSGVRTENGVLHPASAVVSTLPPAALDKVDRPQALKGAWSRLASAPIIGINLWLDRPILAEPLAAMLGTEIHWVFNKSALWSETGPGQYLSLVISGAHRHLRRSPRELFDAARRDMSRCFPAFKKANIEAWTVVKEPFATLSPVCGSDALRPAHRCASPGFFYAGDWTQTGLPATIESAVQSGHACAKLILDGGMR